MSEPFMSLASVGNNMQSAALWRQISRAAYERTLFAGWLIPAGNTALEDYEGFNLQETYSRISNVASESIRGFQEIAYLLATGGRYIRFDLSAPLFFDDPANIEVYTGANIELFFSTAGMSTDGFRRAQHWDGEESWAVGAPMWEREGHGFFQRGDILGPWIVEDLQRAYSELRWALAFQTHRFDDSEYALTVSDTQTSEAAAAVEVAATWPASDAPSNAIILKQWLTARLDGSPDFWYMNVEASMRAFDGFVSANELLSEWIGEIGGMIAFYWKTISPFDTYSEYPVTPQYDAHDLGMIEDHYALFRQAEIQPDGRTLLQFHGNTDLPNQAATPADGEATVRGCIYSAAWAAVRPYFTHEGLA